MQFIWAYIPALIQRTTHFLHLWTTDFSIKYMQTLFNLSCMIQQSLCAPKTQLEYQLLLYKNTNIKLRFYAESVQVVYQNLLILSWGSRGCSPFRKYVDELRYWAVYFTGYKKYGKSLNLNNNKKIISLFAFLLFLPHKSHAQYENK